MCCKKSGCDYSPDDLSPITLNSITKKLEEGNISITSMQLFKYINGKLTNSPFLYLRARNIDRTNCRSIINEKNMCLSYRKWMYI